MKCIRQIQAFLFFILLTGSTAKSQSLYEIKFADKQNVQYSCFLVFFNENNVFMRIAYNYNNAYNVVNVTYSSRNGTNSQGIKYSMLTGYNPVFITENKAGLRYNPDYLIWFFNNTTQNWDTPYTTDDSLLNPTNYVLVTTYRKLDPKTINDAYLRTYFGSNESQYLSLKKMCGLTAGDNSSVAENKNYKFHLVLIANTFDPSIGGGCNTDKINIRNEFRQVADALGLSFQEYIVEGAAFSKISVLNTLNSLMPGPNDIVMFIYRGHGFRWKDQTDDWPRMDLRPSSYADITINSSMNLSEVYTMLQNKGARLNIILGDCCNSEVNISPVTSNNYLTFQVDNNSDISKLKNLFMNSRGTILSSAAQKGEVSWSTPQGGLYSMSFLQAMREEISYLNSVDCNWNNIITKTILLARSKSTPTFCSNCTLQNGIKYVSVGKQ